jgi:hypothetical protein
MNAGVPIPVDTVYAQVDGAPPVLVSGRSAGGCTGACQASVVGAARFAGASDDGSKGFFVSSQQLVDGASEGSPNLYEYDFANPAGHKLLDASAASGSTPGVLGVVAVSADGSHVYFVAQGVLTAAGSDQGQVARAGSNNLYVFERDAAHPEGHIAFITALPSADTQEWAEGGNSRANVTPNGRFLVFLSHGRLTADDTSSSGARQVFRYDAQTGELARVSIGNDGFNDNGNRLSATPCIPDSGQCSEDAHIASREAFNTPRRDLTMSHDGAFVFFQSPVALTPGALNNVQIGTNGFNLPEYAQNVYEWHAGHVYLISDGRDASRDGGQNGSCENEMDLSSVCLLGTDGWGANVFFSTADRLVAADTDSELDYYDARICTAESPCIKPTVAPAGCLGESCHGVAGAAPVFGAPASAALAGAGNLTSPAAKTVVKPKKKAKPKKPKKSKHRHRGRKVNGTGKRVKRGRN